MDEKEKDNFRPFVFTPTMGKPSKKAFNELKKMPPDLMAAMGNAFLGIDQQKKQPSKSGIELPFKCSTNYRNVEFKGRKFRFTERQAVVIKLMVEELKKGNPSVPKAQILKALNASDRYKELNLKEIFKRNPAWNSFIKPTKGQKGLYCLAVPRPK